MPFWACKDICKCIQNVEIWVLHIQERGRRCLKVDLCRPRALNICAWEHLMYVRQMCKQRAHNHIPRTCWPLWVAVAIYTPANLRACHHGGVGHPFFPTTVTIIVGWVAHWGTRVLSSWENLCRSFKIPQTGVFKCVCYQRATPWQWPWSDAKNGYEENTIYPKLKPVAVLEKNLII